jgi:tetratricopeptide (TPR) repeat protein
VRGLPGCAVVAPPRPRRSRPRLATVVLCLMATGAIVRAGLRPNALVAATSSRTEEGAIRVLLTALPEGRHDAGRTPAPVVAAAGATDIPLSRNAAQPVARPTYLILIDVDSLNALDIRQACIVTGAFVDGLDPDDRVAILALSMGGGSASATTDRLAAAHALESTIARPDGVTPAQSGFAASAVTTNRVTATNRFDGLDRVVSRADAVAVVHGDKKTLERLAREAQMVQPGTRTDKAVLPDGAATTYWEERIRRYAETLLGQTASSPLIAATTKVLTSARPSAGRFVIVWMTNSTAMTATDPDRASALVKAAADARATLSIVVTTTFGDSAIQASLHRLATSTGGVFVAGIANVDTVVTTLISATAGPEPRRGDPAGVSELTSLRRCAEHAGDPSEYVPLVEQYRTADAGSAVNAIRAWTPERTVSEVAPLPSLADLQAAVALHLEAGVVNGSSVHLGIARRATEAICSRQPGSAICRHWLLAMSAYSRQSVRDVRMEPAGDASMLVALGSALELPASIETPPGLDRVQPPASDLLHAADLYRQALAKDASFTEARVRLGRVLSLLGQRQEAFAQLERARAEARDPRQVYLACLFLGDLQEAEGNSQAAVTAYRSAVEACPYALAARAALGRVLESRGQHADANQVVREQFAAPAGQLRGRDPWQDYVHGSPDDLARELIALREAVRK